ncbi:hypothetical protein PHAVU_011G197200 [Phaseolus vulgaris]|uniref:Uncharacterized protein n=1 Tax=Phaseolus vulgaris TaxID=3885 RepID=V7AJ92_PHAVU|nr:hypothetical protein PHAVU_011G197200g [Phaseolus vulgaris]ESW05642.1 hypothetical protein PHAVU_011G197200g [Phaseolus vulgaris]
MAISGVRKTKMKSRMERDEDLTLFRELRKRQNEHIPSLLHCVNSEEFECATTNDTHGNFSLYRIPSGRKEYGVEFLETNKNDYDWLKTPPATPLFPSLEMEPGPQLLLQKEIPISQAISRFAWSEVEAPKPKSNDGKTTHTNSTKPKLSTRSMTPSHSRQRPSTTKNTNEQETNTSPTIPYKRNNAKSDHDAFNNTKSTPQKQTNNADFLALNVKKSTETNESQRKLRTRGVSPSVKSRVAVVNNIIELSNETPANLRTDQRSSSTTRGRSTTRSSTVSGFQSRDPTPRTFRASRSPSPSMANGSWNQLERSQRNLRAHKETFTLAASTNEGRAHFKGSKMVEKVMNARKLGMNQVDRETKTKAFKSRV